MLNIKYQYAENKTKFPLVCEEGNSGIDLRSQWVYTVRPHQTVLVDTGLKVEIPKGYEIQIRPRSGMALKNSIIVVNTPGTIDASYRGVIGVILHNLSENPFVIYTGDRIAQLVVAKVETPYVTFIESDSLSETERGEGGFGSTGKK